MTELILVRHGETHLNTIDVIRGRLDVELNDVGTRQAHLLAEYLSQVELEAIYSSPLKRALSTAEEVAAFHTTPVEVADGLVDFNYGALQGMAVSEAREKHPDIYQQWMTHPEQLTMPDGENLEMVRERTMRVIKYIISAYAGKVALVSHNVPLRVMECAMLGLDNSHFWNIKHDNCGITAFIHQDDRFILAELNDTCHLRRLRGTQMALAMKEADQL